MALIGRELAIMSVGIACQAADQIRRNATMLSALAGEELEAHTTPWDWTICGPAGVALMLADGVTFPPAADLEDRAGKPYWPARRCYFWHMKGAITDHADAAVQAARQRGRLESVRGARRKVFILANTQNNLARENTIRGGMDIPLEAKWVDRLEIALTARLGPHELVVVSHAGKHALGARPVIELQPDLSQWAGDDAQWSALLKSIVRA